MKYIVTSFLFLVLLASACGQVATKDYRGAWAPPTAYLQGETVFCNGLTYIAVRDSSGVTPGTDPAYWLPYRAGDVVLPPAGASGAWDSISGKPTSFPADWSAIANKPALATVATSGSYNDLSNRPSIPSDQVSADWNASSGAAQILNKPTIPAAQVQTDWNAASGMGQLLNKPSTFTPSAHGHAESEIANLVTDLAGKQAALGFAPENSANRNASGGYAGLSGGLLAAAQLPNPTTAAKGGVFIAANCSTGQHVNGINTGTGALTCSADTGGSPSLSYAMSQLASPVTMTTGGTFYDGPSIASSSLPSGVWLLNASVTIKSANATAQRVTCKLWDGTTVLASAEGAAPSQGSSTAGYINLHMAWTGSLSGSQLEKVSCTSTAASSIFQAAAGDSGAGNNASTLTAVKVQ